MSVIVTGENLEASDQYRILLFKDWLYKPHWRISGGRREGFIAFMVDVEFSFNTVSKKYITVHFSTNG